MSQCKWKFLGMPSFRVASMHVARGFFHASADMASVIKYHPGSSLLAATFNDIWCAALNHVHHGGELAYFAMQHDDVAPEDGWLDKAIEELEANDLDVLGVVIPIKDSRGRTSLALDDPGDNWMPYCRLSLHDVHRLPPTFTSADLGRPLLLNTGLWVMRWNQDVSKQLGFEVNDRIVFNRAVNRFQAQTEPEDWRFSRLAHEMGLKIGATRKIHVYHHGEYRFTNEMPWGERFDNEVLKESPVPAVDRDGFRYPFDVDGWLTYDEGKALWRLAKGKRVLEIGSYCGKSTICLAQSAKDVLAVDYHDGRATDTPRPTRSDFEANLTRYGVRDNVDVALPEHLEIWGQHDFELAFIDGDHSYEAVRSDIEHSLRLLAPGGLIAFHDYREQPSPERRWDPGVNQAVKELLASGGELLFHEASLAVVRPPALIPQEV